MVPPPCSSSTNWERREATRGHRLHGVGHHLRPRPRAARRRGMGWDLLLPGRAGCHAARRLADRSPDQGRSRPGPPGRGVSRHAAPRGARGAVRRGAGGQQPRHAPLLPARAPLRADVGRRPAVDLARARSPGDGPGRAVHQLHFGLRDGPGDGAAVAPRPPPDAPAWFGCFDTVQLNSDEMEQLGPDPLAVAAGALARGCHTLVVTLGPRGAAYFTGDPVRTALIPAEGTSLPDGDPTGCGDVLGATVAASLIAGAGLEAALRLGTRMGARNVSHRGASGLRDHLLGRLSAV